MAPEPPGRQGCRSRGLIETFERMEFRPLIPVYLVLYHATCAMTIPLPSLVPWLGPVMQMAVWPTPRSLPFRDTGPVLPLLTVTLSPPFITVPFMQSLIAPWAVATAVLIR